MRLRSSGVLLHISSLPSLYGIGDLGPEAHVTARLLAGNGQSLWQMLPLTPVSRSQGNSPYASYSAFAGNTLLLSPETLVQDGFLRPEDLDTAREEAGSQVSGSAGRVDFAWVERHRATLLRQVWTRNRDDAGRGREFADFKTANALWLDDFARFVTIKAAHEDKGWTAWPESLARRDPAALAAWDREHDEDLEKVRFGQFLFFRQWSALRRTCRDLGLRLVGDAPIYVTHDSSDVWAHPELFLLDEKGDPRVVAGVPPDYFSPTGQRWGNPLYDWKALARTGFDWWIRRLGHAFGMFDCVRLDHFRGFAGYWEIDALEQTAVNGKWVEARGRELFLAAARRLGALPIIAEDLGVITPDVRELQRELQCPGMAVLQFGFGGRLADNPHAPFMHRPNQAVYTGTHDNPPTRGWFREQASWEEKQTLSAYAGHEVTEDNAARTLTRLALASVADMALVPVQDVLDLDLDSRMNVPATLDGNWSWRLLPGQLDAASLSGLRDMTRLFGREG